MRPGIPHVGEGEGVDTECRREVNLVAFNFTSSVSSGRQVAVKDVFGGGDEVLSATDRTLIILITGRGGGGEGGYTGAKVPQSLFISNGEVLTDFFGGVLARACRAMLRIRLRMKAGNNTINRTVATSVIPVLRPLLLYSAPMFTNILEIPAADLFMLFNVEPKVEDVLTSLTLDEYTRVHVVKMMQIGGGNGHGTD